MVEMTSEERVYACAATTGAGPCAAFRVGGGSSGARGSLPGLQEPSMILLCRWDRMPSSLIRSYKKERVGTNRWLSEWGYVSQDTNEEHGIEVESPIKTMADFERFTPPDPHAPERFAAVEDAVQKYQRGQGCYCPPE